MKFKIKALLLCLTFMGGNAMAEQSNEKWPAQFHWKDYSKSEKLKEAVDHYFPIGSDFNAARDALIADGFSMKEIKDPPADEYGNKKGILFVKNKKAFIPFLTADCSWMITFKENKSVITYAFANIACTGV